MDPLSFLLENLENMPAEEGDKVITLLRFINALQPEAAAILCKSPNIFIRRLGEAALFRLGISTEKTAEVPTYTVVGSPGPGLDPPRAPQTVCEFPASLGVSKQAAVIDRPKLVGELSGLSAADWAMVLAAIPGAGAQVSRNVTVAEQVEQLFRWAESSTGPGLVGVIKALGGLRESPRVLPPR
jgi:hypothetical protein